MRIDRSKHLRRYSNSGAPNGVRCVCVWVKRWNSTTIYSVNIIIWLITLFVFEFVRLWLHLRSENKSNIKCDREKGMEILVDFPIIFALPEYWNWFEFGALGNDVKKKLYAKTTCKFPIETYYLLNKIHTVQQMNGKQF